MHFPQLGGWLYAETAGSWGQKQGHPLLRRPTAAVLAGLLPAGQENSLQHHLTFQRFPGQGELCACRGESCEECAIWQS